MRPGLWARDNGPMADQKPAGKQKKPSRVPWGPLIWGGVATALAVRTFYHPARAVVADGFVAQCAGPLAGAAGCSRVVVIDQFGGAGPVYSVASGRVIQVIEQRGPAVEGAPPRSVSVKIAAAHEPVVLEYSGALQLQVSEGEEVGIGQQIALGSKVGFGVTELGYVGNNLVEGTQLEPASWLAARGLRISQKSHKADTSGQNWCEGGRKLQVPEAVGLCGMKLPAPAGLMLLPVTVRMV